MADNVKTVQAGYEAFGRGDIPAILEHMADDVEWEPDSVDHGVPWLTPGRGKDHVAAFFGTLSQLEFRRFEPQNLLAGGNQVAAPIVVEVDVKATGRPIRDFEIHLWTFGDDGKVTGLRHFADTHQHLGAYRGD